MGKGWCPIGVVGDVGGGCLRHLDDADVVGGEIGKMVRLRDDEAAVVVISS